MLLRAVFLLFQVRMLSQFPHEQEKLFPPLTMLQLEPDQGDSPGDLQPKMVKHGGGWVKYVHIKATPIFV
jgi:hypothetical protein